MIDSIIIHPQLFNIGEWEFPIDISLTTKRKKVKDTSRQVFIEKIDNHFVVTMRKRTESYSRIKVLDNLWRLIPKSSDWIEIFKLTLYKRFTKFTINDIDFIVELEIINKYQINMSIIYEQRDVSAEEAGSIPPFIEIKEDWSYSET